ncbi:MAG: glycine--tRNA ligase subunit beta [Candidatus Krumholzibacteria bacterium]|nr:glycine--tRNA ligase subunit beta [Candidatus Krumholzibacteria bacterium]
MKKELLIEIGCENLPSGYINGALRQLEGLFSGGLEAERIKYGSIYVSGTPNRLVVHIRDIDEKQEASEETIMGPPVSVAVDKDGNFTKAAEGFARREGVAAEDLKKITTDRGEYLAIVKKIRGKTAKAVLVDNVPEWISGIRFPKVMKWDDSSFRFARPVRWVLALYGGKVLPFRLGSVSSSSSTRVSPYFEGFMKVNGIPEYFEILKKNRIILDHEERKRRVSKMAGKAAVEVGGLLVNDEALSGMVANLIESPVVMSGSFDPSFLELPREVIVTALKSHQRYFSIEDKNGDLLPSFVAFADGARKNKLKITRGYERVLQARLADARFYFMEDTSYPIEKMAAKLADIVWLEGLGTLRQKSERIERLSGWIHSTSGYSQGQLKENIARAAGLLKADLASEMVKDGKEFTLLQGYIGREYSRISGEPEEVSTAIYEHYFPKFSGDRLPEGDAGTVLSLADRFDTIMGCWIQGLGPTGNQDPYALRRHAISILRIAVERNLDLDLPEAISRSCMGFSDLGLVPDGFDREKVTGEVTELFSQRFITMLRSQDFDHDIVSSIMMSPWTVPFAAREMIEKLQAMRNEGSLGDFILAMKRVTNIIPKGMREKVTFESGIKALNCLSEDKGDSCGFSRSLFTEKSEIGLFTSASEAGSRLLRLALPGEGSSSIKILAGLVPAINDFFDEVLINCEDGKTRENRLGLMKCLHAAFGLFCDYSMISGEQ